LGNGVGKGARLSLWLWLRHIINLVQWPIGHLRRHSFSDFILFLHSLLAKIQPPSCTCTSLWHTSPHSTDISASDHYHTTHTTIPTPMSRRKSDSDNNIGRLNKPIQQRWMEEKYLEGTYLQITSNFISLRLEKQVIHFSPFL